MSKQEPVRLRYFPQQTVNLNNKLGAVLKRPTNFKWYSKGSIGDLNTYQKRTNYINSRSTENTNTILQLPTWGVVYCQEFRLIFAFQGWFNYSLISELCSNINWSDMPPQWLRLLLVIWWIVLYPDIIFATDWVLHVLNQSGNQLINHIWLSHHSQTSITELQFICSTHRSFLFCFCSFSSLPISVFHWCSDKSRGGSPNNLSSSVLNARPDATRRRILVKRIQQLLIWLAQFTLKKKTKKKPHLTEGNTVEHEAIPDKQHVQNGGN